MTDKETIRLHNIGGGAAIELFDDCLAMVLADIGDINTIATSPRTIKLEFKFKPDADRSVGEIEIYHVVVKGKIKPVKTRAIMGLDNDGMPQAFEYAPQQQRSMWTDKQISESPRITKPTIKVVNE